MTEHLGVHVKDRHRALGDAEATAKVLLIMFRMLLEREITTVGATLAFATK